MQIIGFFVFKVYVVCDMNLLLFYKCLVNGSWNDQQNARNIIESIVIIVKVKAIIDRLSVLSDKYHALWNVLRNKYHF